MLHALGDWWSSSGSSQRSRGSLRRRSKRRSKRESLAQQFVPGVRIKLDRAEYLSPADNNGLADPYVLFRIGKLSKHKTSVVKKTLEPTWLEEFFLPCPEFTSVPLDIEVRDKDSISSDVLGKATIDISMLAMGDDPEELQVDLSNDGKPSGQLYMSIVRDEEHIDFVRDKEKVRQWAIPKGERMVVVELIEARELLAGDTNGLSDPYCILRLNKIKHTSRYIKRTLTPKWRQRFEFPLQEGEDPTLYIKVMDRDFLRRDDFLGSFEVNLDDLQPKIVNDRWFDVYHEGDAAGHVHMLVTVIDLDSLELTREQREEMVGSVRVHCVKARNLRSADMNGRSDPYVELSLGNARLRTPVIHKNLNPVWDTVLELPAKDIFASLHVDVWDEDRGSRPDHLGSVLIPLLDIHNGQTEWFALKTPDLLRKGQGEIQLAMQLEYKIPHAYLGIIRRKDVNLMEKRPPFSVRRLRNAINRLNANVMPLVDGVQFLINIFFWKYGPIPSLIGVVVWCIVCTYFRPFMAPGGIALLILAQLFVNYQGSEVIVDERGLVLTRFDDRGFATSHKTDRLIMNNFDNVDLDDNLEDGDLGSDLDSLAGSDDEGENAIAGSAPKSHAKVKKPGRKGVLAQVHMLTSIAREVQGYLDFTASLLERIKNLFNWSVPLATEIVFFFFAILSVLIYFVAWNKLLMYWGLWKFTKNAYLKYIRPRSKFHIPIIEGIELLKRIPTDLEKVMRRRIITEDMTLKRSHRLLAGFGRA